METSKIIRLLDEPVPPHECEILYDGNVYVQRDVQICKANDLFGEWSYETFIDPTEHIAEHNGTMYVTRFAKVTVKTPIGTRTGCGGDTMKGKGSNLGTAQVNAVKAAETSAIKRALSSFGFALGLCLYDSTYATMVKGILQGENTDDWKLFSPTYLEELAQDHEANRDLLVKAYKLCRSRFEKYAQPIIKKNKVGE